jgi:hypothetical protein
MIVIHSFPSTAPCPQSGSIISDFTNALKSDAVLVLMSHTGTWKWAVLNKRVQSHLKPACAVVVKAWEALDPICLVSSLWKRDTRNLNDYHTRQSSNFKLFGA